MVASASWKWPSISNARGTSTCDSTAIWTRAGGTRAGVSATVEGVYQNPTDLDKVGIRDSIIDYVEDETKAPDVTSLQHVRAIFGEMTFYPSDGRKVKGVIHWVDAATAQAAEGGYCGTLVVAAAALQILSHRVTAQTAMHIHGSTRLELCNGI